MVNSTWTCWKSGVTYVCRHFNVLKVESRLKVAASNIQLVDIKENSTEVYAHNISWLLLQQPSTPSNAWKQSFNSEPLFSTISRLCCMASLLAFSAVVWAKAFTSTTPWGEGSFPGGPRVPPFRCHPCRSLPPEHCAATEDTDSSRASTLCKASSSCLKG